MYLSPVVTALVTLTLMIVIGVASYLVGYSRASMKGDYRILVEQGKQKKLLVTISEEVVRTVNPELPDEVVHKRARDMVRIATPPQGLEVQDGDKTQQFHRNAV